MVARHHRRRWGCFLGPMEICEAGGDAGGGQSQSPAIRSYRCLGKRSVGPACHWRLLIAHHMLILQVRKSFNREIEASENARLVLLGLDSTFI